MTERIPEEVLKAAHLRWCRRVAVAIMSAFAETGMSYEEVEARLDLKKGFTRRWLNSYMEGTTREGLELTDLCCAMNCEPVISLSFFAPQPPPPKDEDQALAQALSASFSFDTNASEMHIFRTKLAEAGLTLALSSKPQGGE
jgi:hypothetical protein